VLGGKVCVFLMISIGCQGLLNFLLGSHRNYRILSYSRGQFVASRVWGQPDFVSNGELFNLLTIAEFLTVFVGSGEPVRSASQFNPGAIAWSSSGMMFVADPVWNRILGFASGSFTATVVLGQAGSFTSGIAGASESRLRFPNDLAMDSQVWFLHPVLQWLKFFSL
jgi:hypothetical protein